jgi:hypothetical protein
MLRRLARNVSALFVLAAIQLTVVEVSGHRVPVLPADASPGPVIAGALLLAVTVTVAEQNVRRLRR